MARSTQFILECARSAFGLPHRRASNHNNHIHNHNNMQCNVCVSRVWRLHNVPVIQPCVNVLLFHVRAHSIRRVRQCFVRTHALFILMRLIFQLHASATVVFATASAAASHICRRFTNIDARARAGCVACECENLEYEMALRGVPVFATAAAAAAASHRAHNCALIIRMPEERACPIGRTHLAVARRLCQYNCFNCCRTLQAFK